MKKKQFKDTRDAIASFLPGLVKEKGWEVQVDLHSLFLDWQDIVGNVAQYASPEKIKTGVLYIQVENSAWLQQLQYQKVELLEKLNARLKLSHLQDIRFILASEGKKQKEQEQKSAVRFEPPPAEEQEAFRNQIASLENEEIRESLMRIWYLSKACKRDE